MTTKSDDSNYSESHEKSLALHAGDKKARTAILAKIKKEYGESVHVAEPATVESISTGSLVLDIATGIGGYPRGRISQIAGWESSGKTTHALKAVANLQERGGSVAFIDTEFALDPKWAEKQGVNMSNLEWIQPENLETAGEVAVDLAESGVFDMVIFDSVAGAATKAVLAGELGDANMGKRARIMSDMMPKLNGPVSRNNIWMIFTNQLRSSLDMYKPLPVRPGGHALNFHSSLTIDLKAKKDKGFSTITATIAKNKVARPFREAIYKIDMDGYIDVVDELAEILTTAELLDAVGVVRAGAWYTLPAELFPDFEDSKFNGKAKIVEALADLDVYDRVSEYVKRKLF